MFKAIWLLKRKEGITPEQFRHHYEESHARLAKKYFGNLMIRYERNYKTGCWGRNASVDLHSDGIGFGPIDWKYDCVVEWLMSDEGAFEEINRILANRVIGKEFRDDEEKFLDHESVILLTCEMASAGTGDV